MTSGTKIALAVICLFITFIVVYYTVIVPSDPPGGPQQANAMPPPPEVLANDDEQQPNPVAWVERSDDPRSAPQNTLVTPPSRTGQPNLEPEQTNATPILPPPPEVENQTDNDEARAISETPPDEFTIYTVRESDTLTDIAAYWFGDHNKWDLIAKANPYIDPNRLTVGTELRLPPKDATRQGAGMPPEVASPVETVYVVRPGDNLTGIARTYYSDPNKWRVIFEANRETMRNDPDFLRVGMKLTIPPAPEGAE